MPRPTIKQIAEMKATSGVSVEEGNALINLVYEERPSVLFEIGSCEGRSAAYICTALRLIEEQSPGQRIRHTLHCVDLWTEGKGITPEKHHNPEAEKRFMSNLRFLGLFDLVEMHKGSSIDMSEKWGLRNNTNIDFLFIDAGHAYNDVHSDYLLWARFLRPGGVLVFHDADQEGVSKVIEQCENDWQWWRLPVELPKRLAAFRLGTGLRNATTDFKY